MRNRKFILTSLVALTSLLGIFSIYFAYNLSSNEEPEDVSVAQSCACCVNGSSNSCTGVSGTHVNYGDPLAGSQSECPQAFPVFVGCFDTGPTCGNGQVESGEGCEGSSQIACTTTTGYAGVRTCSSCQYGACATAQYCGDLICSGSETLANCPSDCTNCGDGICSDSETGVTCAADCDTECDDNLDNDGDGNIDCADAQCLNSSGTCDPSINQEGLDVACNDGLDNDGDGKIDCGGPNGEAADPGCFPDGLGGGTCSTADRSEIDGVAPLPQTGFIDDNKIIYFGLGILFISLGLFLTRSKFAYLPKIEFVLENKTSTAKRASYIKVNSKPKSTYKERQEFQEKF